MRINKLGKYFIFGGLLLIAAALCLIVYNFYEDTQAANTVSDVLEEIRGEQKVPPETNDLSTQATKPDKVETEPELIIPDYMRDPNMAMPTEEINGEAYIWSDRSSRAGAELAGYQ